MKYMNPDIIFVYYFFKKYNLLGTQMFALGKLENSLKGKNKPKFTHSKKEIWKFGNSLKGKNYKEKKLKENLKKIYKLKFKSKRKSSFHRRINKINLKSEDGSDGDGEGEVEILYTRYFIDLTKDSESPESQDAKDSNEIVNYSYRKETEGYPKIKIKTEVETEKNPQNKNKTATKNENKNKNKAVTKNRNKTGITTATKTATKTKNKTVPNRKTDMVKEREGDTDSDQKVPLTYIPGNYCILLYDYLSTQILIDKVSIDYEEYYQDDEDNVYHYDNFIYLFNKKDFY
ncbi:hypothetical protein PIROE2DRAFT_56849 [Piromyces sp. E2]|nr:hypothetical protein PIROE2DRAFT_56849 [Piromyces sp. E2]|eukprot:OUM70359.1 hypothetical protein PIROE2DRAFT_56849 [Piromyces sp. E2]